MTISLFQLYALLMPEDQPASQPSNAFSYDPAKFEKLVENMLGSYRNYREDSAVALSRMTDMNKEISSFNEKLMLLRFLPFHS